MLYRYQKPLQEIYDEYLRKYQETGVKPYPDKLLALLLLQEKDKYEPLKVCEGEFYKFYKKQIDEKIEKVINDFHITKEDIISFIEQKGICYREEEYENDKIWFVFAEGFGSMHWAIMYHPSHTPEKVYDECYGCFHGQYKKENTNNRKRTLMRYKEKVRRKNGRQYN